jgi:hypothetical protein
MADPTIAARLVIEIGPDDTDDATAGLERSADLVIVKSSAAAICGAAMNVSASIKLASAIFAVFFMVPSLWGWAYRLGQRPVMDAVKTTDAGVLRLRIRSGKHVSGFDNRLHLRITP